MAGAGTPAAPALRSAFLAALLLLMPGACLWATDLGAGLGSGLRGIGMKAEFAAGTFHASPSLAPTRLHCALPPAVRSPSLDGSGPKPHHPPGPPSEAVARPAQAAPAVGWPVFIAGLLAAVACLAAAAAAVTSQPRAPRELTALSVGGQEEPPAGAPAAGAVPPPPPDKGDEGMEPSEGTPMLIDQVAGLPLGLGTALQWAVLIAPFFMWGTSMVAMKETLDHTGALFIAGVRCVPAGLLILGFLAARGQPLLPRTARAWAWVGAFALVDGTAFQGFRAEGPRRTSAGLGSVIIDSQPLTVAVLASLLFREALGPKGILGLLLGVVGLGLVELDPENVQELSSMVSGMGAAASIWDRGEWWMLLAAQSMALGTVMVRLFMRDVDPVLATGWHLLLGGLPLFALSAVYDGPLLDQVAFLTAGDWARLAYVSVFGGAVSFGLFFFAAERGSLTRLSSLTFLTPMFAVLGGYFFLAETLSPVQALGAFVTLGAIYLINSPK